MARWNKSPKPISVRVTPNYHRGAANRKFAGFDTVWSRKQETIDKTRTMQDSVKVYVRYLNATNPPNRNPLSASFRIRH